MKLTPHDLMNAWNVNRGDMRLCSTLDHNERRRLAEARLAEAPDLTRWVKAIQRASKSAFLTGRVSPAEGQTPFVATFDWLLKPGTLVKIEEGIFDQRVIEAPDTPSPQKDRDYWGKAKPVFAIDDPRLMKAIMRAAERMKDLEMAQRRHLTGGEQQRIIDEECGKDVVEVVPCQGEPVAVGSRAERQINATAGSATTRQPAGPGPSSGSFPRSRNGPPAPDPRSTLTSNEERFFVEPPANRAAGSSESRPTTSPDTNSPSSSNGSAADATAENTSLGELLDSIREPSQDDPEETLEFPY